MAWKFSSLSTAEDTCLFKNSFQPPTLQGSDETQTSEWFPVLLDVCRLSARPCPQLEDVADNRLSIPLPFNHSLISLLLFLTFP